MRNSELAQVLLSLSQPEARLYPWQEKWLDDSSRFRILLKSRAVGGSFLIALESLLNALLTPGSTILLFSYSLRQSVELFRKIRNHVARWKNARVKHDDVVYVFPEALETKTTLEFPNESRIIALPNNPEAVRGYRADVVYVDEAAMFKDDFALKAAVIPLIVGRNGRLALISTPKGKRGWFYEAWAGDTFSKHRVHYTEAPHITQEDLEGIKASLSPLEWQQEMELQFLDEINAVFPYDVILACSEDYETRLERPSNPVYVGVDFGRYRDSTVITCLEKQEDGKLRVFFIHEFLRTDFETQLNFILKLAGILSPAAIAVDKTGLGIPLHDILSKRLPQTEGVTFTANVKQAIVHTLVNVFANRRITVPANATQLINQLAVFQRVDEKYSAPEGEHDDYVMSLGLAVYAALKNTRVFSASKAWEWRDAHES